MSVPSSPARRLGILFHESEVLGAGVSILRVLPLLATHGWTSTGWFPGPGPLVDETADALAGRAGSVKPIAFSSRGWRQSPGIWSRLRRTPGYLRTFASWLDRAGPDVVHANSLLMLPEATIARRRGIPVVLQVHELPEAGGKRTATIRWAAAVADVLIGVATPVCGMLRAHAGRTPVLSVHNGVGPWEAHGPRCEDIVVGSVGYVSRTKGTDLFLRAAELARAERSDLRFEHVGQQRLWGDAVFDDAFDAAVRSRALDGAFTLLGRASVPDALGRWSMFVLPSRREGFPLSTLEAMAAGLPVIASGVGGVPEQIEHLRTGILVPPEQPDVIAEWIVKLHDDEQLRTRLGEAAKSHVSTAFTLSAQAAGLDDAYRLALRRRSARMHVHDASAVQTID
jgi:glycosyltransferase involved in cell wall biosynthesis